ncbi:MAG: flavodoxin family protein [Nitrospirota bacterium]
MNIVCLLGSPRPNGNSAAIAKHFLDTAASLGGHIQTFELNKLAYRGCQGCLVCKTRLDKCVLKDDLTRVLDAVHEADVLVLATPVYYGDVTGQLKLYLDRTYSYLKPDYLTNPQPSRLAPGKRLVFIVTQGHPDEAMFNDVFPRYDKFFKWYGFKESHLIRACGVSKAGEVVSQKNIMKRAEETARNIMK